MKQCRREKRSFLHTLIIGNKKQTSPKKYRTLISLILLGHMQKISHFWAKMRKDPKCQLGHFCPEPFNSDETGHLEPVIYLTKGASYSYAHHEHIGHFEL